jgi:GT2 family glycosyltransferase
MRGGRVELGDPSDMPFTIKTDILPEQMNDVHFPGGFVIGANMVIPRAIIEDVGLFDERFGAGAYLKAAEDTDYIHRVYRKGYKIEYQPDLVVHHFHGRKTLDEVRKLHAQYNIGNGALYAKHCTDLKLLRHFYWDCRKAIKGVAPHEGIDLSPRAVVVGNMKGAFKYACLSVRAGIRSTLTALRETPTQKEVVLHFGPQLHTA